MSTTPPDSIATISPAWLTGVLRRGGAIVQSNVTAVAADVIGTEVGFLDCVAGLTLTYDRIEPAAPRSLVVKVSASAGLYRQIGEFYDAYQREANFYEHVAPHSLIRLARCFGHETVAATGAHFLFLEDLRALSPGDQVTGLTPTAARACLETIGRFHAAWWQTPRLSELEWMPTRNVRAARYQAMWQKFQQDVGPRLSSTQRSLGQRLANDFDTILSAVEAHPQTIVHSDFRADNLLFDSTSTSSPVVVLDWQLAIRGNGMLDVARLLGGSLRSEDRSACEVDLLRVWHEQLLRGGVRNYSFEQAVAAYRKAVLLCLYYPVTIHEAEEAAGPRGTALAHAQIERFFAAAENAYQSFSG